MLVTGGDGGAAAMALWPPPRWPTPLAKKAWKSSVEFEARLPVRGKVTMVYLCEDCESEGEIRFRMARDPAKGWGYDLKDKATYVDVQAFDPKDTYEKLRVGDWIDGTLVTWGYLKHTWAGPVGIDGEDRAWFASGVPLRGQVALELSAATVDFGFFHARLGFEDAEQMRRVLTYERIKEGSFVRAEPDVELTVKRWGPRDDVVGHERRK